MEWLLVSSDGSGLVNPHPGFQVRVHVSAPDMSLYIFSVLKAFSISVNDGMVYNNNNNSNFFSCTITATHKKCLDFCEKFPAAAA